MATPKKSGSGSAGAKKAAGAGGSRPARGGIAQQVTPSPELAAIVGKEPLTRADLTKRVWDYIKKNDLQDAKNRRQINADANLRKIFGKDNVTMFEMTKLVNNHVKK